jgi:hypothetical protein
MDIANSLLLTHDRYSAFELQDASGPSWPPCLIGEGGHLTEGYLQIRREAGQVRG